MGLGRRFRVLESALGRRRFAVIVVVLSQCNELLVVAELHLERVALRRN
jgi:hypothetical protein